jgi:hypothetical protein
MSDLAELFERDPLQLSDQDIDRIIADLRERRKTFNTTGKAAKPKAKPTSTIPGLEIDI